MMLSIHSALPPIPTFARYALMGCCIAAAIAIIASVGLQSSSCKVLPAHVLAMTKSSVIGGCMSASFLGATAIALSLLPEVKQIVSIQDPQAPLPGYCQAIHVKVGDRVAKGDVLCTLEVMKMEITIRAPKAGMIKEISLKEGIMVDQGVPLFHIG